MPRLDGQKAAFQPRDVEHVIDHRQKAPAALVDVAGIFAIGRIAHRTQNLVTNDLGKAQYGVERCLQLMAHGRQEGRLHLVGDLGLAQGGAQRPFLFEFFGDVLHRAFIAEHRSGPVAHCARILRYPDAPARTLIDFGDKVCDDVVGLHQGAKLGSPLGFDIKLGADVGKSCDQRLGRGIAIDVGQRLVDRDVAAVGRGAEYAFNGLVKEGAVADFAGAEALARVVGHPRQHHKHAAQDGHDHQTAKELVAQIEGQTQPQHGTRCKCGAGDRDRGRRRARFRLWFVDRQGHAHIWRVRRLSRGPAALLVTNPKCPVAAIGLEPPKKMRSR